MPIETIIRRLKRPIDAFCYGVAALTTFALAAHLIEAAPRIALELAAR